MKKISSIFASLLFVVSVHATSLGLGYITGNDYLKLQEESRLSWLVGVMDGIMAESAMIQKDKNGPWLGRCINGLDMQQIKAIFEKELNSNPEGWHAPAAIIFRFKMESYCKGKI